MKCNEDIEVLAGQLVGQKIMPQILISEVMLNGTDFSAALRHAIDALSGSILRVLSGVTHIFGK